MKRLVIVLYTIATIFVIQGCNSVVELRESAKNAPTLIKSGKTIPEAPVVVFSVEVNYTSQGVPEMYPSIIWITNLDTQKTYALPVFTQGGMVGLAMIYHVPRRGRIYNQSEELIAAHMPVGNYQITRWNLLGYVGEVKFLHDDLKFRVSPGDNLYLGRYRLTLSKTSKFGVFMFGDVNGKWAFERLDNWGKDSSWIQEEYRGIDADKLVRFGK